MPVGTSARPPPGASVAASRATQIGAGVARAGVGRQRQVGIETDDRDVEHDGRVTAAPTAKAAGGSVTASPAAYHAPCSCGWTSR